ncbi:MAG: hypothetical protein M0R30_01255 [Methanoregula sp.]|jgi:hypothetical protein|uniref:hypothetical protein n=1 Tax=Methanoregula sp. TaxID=2052170 RepID=UPI0025DBBF54|nr:hypothetical protein [Methanoregula sp.]MCK9630242.1 hypothetical protein [Methanoregula sp.]
MMTPFGSILFAIGLILVLVGFGFGIYYFSIKNFWPRILFLIIIWAVLIGVMMITNEIAADKIQSLLSLFVTINIAIITIAFAAIAIKPESFLSIKTDFRNFLLITAFWILLEIMVYCLSFFDIFDKSIGFKVFLAGSTIIQIVLIFNLMFYTIKMFDAVVVPVEKKPTD